MRIFHTSDMHLGLKFTRGYPDEVRQKLVDARLETLGRLVDRANEERCNLFVVAGDLFDNNKGPKAIVRQAGQMLRRFEGLVVVLPGNHDFIQQTDDPLWPTLTDALGEAHLVLAERRPYDLGPFGLDAVLYPGVCTSRHSEQNAIGWVREAIRDELPPDSTARAPSKLRVGIAHGSLEGLSPDFSRDYYPMTRAELDQSGVHIWLLGHTHVRYPDREGGTGETIFFPSVPEPDGFDCRHGGHAWVIDLSADGTAAFRSVPTGTFRFHEMSRKVSNEADLEKLRRHFRTLDPNRDLVKLSLSGRLPGELFESLHLLATDLEKHVLYLDPDVKDVVREITQADIDREFTEGSFPHRLLTELAGSPDDAQALQLAYELIGEARQ